MHIGIISSACQGKTTLINDFLKEWPMYKKSDESYRKAINEKKIPHSKQATRASQQIILDYMLTDTLENKKKTHTISDRTSLDNLVYSLWRNAQGDSDIDDEFIEKCISIMREDIRAYDVLFFLPITRVAPVPIVERENRETDPIYIKEIDILFKTLFQCWKSGKSNFFDNQDTPPIIEIFGSPLERIEMLKLYLNTSGDPIDTVQSVLSDDNIKQMEMVKGLIHEQLDIKKVEDESALKEQKIIRGVKFPNSGSILE